MSENIKKVQDQMQNVLDQINNNTDQAFGWLTTVSEQMEKLVAMSFDEAGVINKSAQKISKDLLTSSCSNANEAVKVAKSCIEGPLNLLKQ
ncbi:MAG: hypothetical protein KJP19_08465 [Deltaproteobacteria bacterium]|nr:hypothetical protein [Deltaproteobacteria bacterium]